MQKVSAISKVPLVKSSSLTPAPGEWAIKYKPDGSFAQQIVVQLTSEDALKSITRHTNGSGVRVGAKMWLSRSDPFIPILPQLAAEP